MNNKERAALRRAMVFIHADESQGGSYDKGMDLLQELLDAAPEPTAGVLRCPFCGRKPSVRKGQRYKRDGFYNKAGDWFMKPGVGCRPCRVDRHFESVEEALAWWNKRADVS